MKNFTDNLSVNALSSMTERRSVRAYLPRPVDPQTLHELLVSARLAPSGANLQPGSFVQVQGGARESLSNALVQAWVNG